MVGWEAWLVGAAVYALSLFSAGHALLFKRDPRAAIGWIVTCIALPGVGAALYWLLGVNRIQRQARRLRPRWLPPIAFIPERSEFDRDPEPIPDEITGHLRELARITNAVTRRPLVPGNRVTPLFDGEDFFEEALAAIERAERTVHLSTYIFYVDCVGRRFVDALADAARRGVDVKVLVDGYGELYGWPLVSRALRRRGVRVERFLPPSLRHPGLHMNLRIHRKILVVDGKVGWTGGMNVGANQLARRPVMKRPVVDLHFRVEGPVVAQMEEIFLEDWQFVSGEDSSPVAVPDPAGSAVCRGVSAGPDEQFEKLQWMFLGAISDARRRVFLMTPYFLPNRELVAMITAASLRGVQVVVAIPERNNVPLVAWAMRAVLWELLASGVRVVSQPGPFVHSKLLIVDDHYVLLGSTNLDARSLRLNFEFNLEVFGRESARELVRHFREAVERSRDVTMAELDARPLWQRLRDAAAWVLSPYL